MNLIMEDGEMTTFGYVCFVIIACFFLAVEFAVKMPEQRFDSLESRLLCGTVCEVKPGSKWCFTPCPGPRCPCVKGVDRDGNEFWMLDATIGDE